MEIKLDIGNDSEVRKAINKMIREEFDKVLNEKVCHTLFDHLNNSWDNLIENSIRHIVENAHGGTPWLNNLSIERMTKIILKEMLEPYLSDVTISFKLEPKIKKK